MIQDQNSQIHIYLADDDNDDRAMLAEVLLELDSSITLTQVENGKDLMKLLNAPPRPLPDLILLDLNMPKKDGFECLKEIRANEKMKDLDVIIFSTCSYPTTIARALELGATFYAVKPSTFNNLKSLADEILQIARSCKSNDRNATDYLISPQTFDLTSNKYIKPHFHCQY